MDIWRGCGIHKKLFEKPGVKATCGMETLTNTHFLPRNAFDFEKGGGDCFFKAPLVGEQASLAVGKKEESIPTPEESFSQD